MEVIKEGHLELYSGALIGYSRKYFVIDLQNAFIGYALNKADMFTTKSRIIPAVGIEECFEEASLSDRIEGEHDELLGRTFIIKLKSQKSSLKKKKTPKQKILKLRIERSDSLHSWVHHVQELIQLVNGTLKLQPEDRTGNVRISWRTDAVSDAPTTTYELTEQIATSISPDSSPATITKEYELIFVACDPSFLRDSMRMSPVENEIFGAQRSFTFHTQIMEVDVNGMKGSDVKGRIDPAVMNKMVGDLHAYRNESIKTVGENVPAKVSGNMLITTYQMLGPGKTMSDEEMRERLAQNVQTFDWFPFRKYTFQESLHTKYFNHFSNPDLVRGLLWKLIDIQGDHRTIYINGAACFEAVLQLWQYQNMIFEVPKVKESLPKNKSAPIAIIGAGPAGLIVAVRLKRLGYTNIEFIEASDRYGGKSISLTKSTSSGNIVCELGTCYLSSDYDPFIKDFKEYIEAQIPVPSTVDRDFVTDDPRLLREGIKKIDTFDNYAIAVGMEEEHAPGWKNLTRAEVLYDFYQYSLLHERIFKDQLPFPRYQPEAFKGAFGTQTFLEFLQINGFSSIIGILTYSYQAQGYGTLATIPAFYGLIWITPTLLHHMFIDAIGGTLFPNTYVSHTINYMKDGWSSAWTNIMEKNKFPIHYNARITKINRPFGM